MSGERISEKPGSFLEFVLEIGQTVLQADNVKNILVGETAYPAGKVDIVLGGDARTVFARTASADWTNIALVFFVP